jgi:hypothetical protein
MTKRLHEHAIEQNTTGWTFVIWHISRKSETGVEIDAKAGGFASRGAALEAMQNAAHEQNLHLRSS